MRVSIRLKRIAITMVAALIVFSFPAMERILSSPDPHQPLPRALTNAELQGVTLTADVTKLLISWSFGLLAALGWSVKRHIEGAADLTAFGKCACVLGAVAAIYSAFFGQVLLTSLAWLLSKNILALDDRSIILAGTLQAVSMLLALIFTGIYLTDGLLQHRQISRESWKGN